MQPLQSELSLTLLYDDIPLFELDIAIFTALNVVDLSALLGHPVFDFS